MSTGLAAAAAPQTPNVYDVLLWSYTLNLANYGISIIFHPLLTLFFSKDSLGIATWIAAVLCIVASRDVCNDRRHFALSVLSMRRHKFEAQVQLHIVIQKNANTQIQNTIAHND